MSQRPERPSPHFTWREASCRCCGALPDEAVIINTARFMEQIRELLGNQPLTINSWFRCERNNRRAGGASNSQHLTGYAVDFVHATLTPVQVERILKPHLGEVIDGTGPLGGLGTYLGKRFTHVDRRTGAPAHWRE